MNKHRPLILAIVGYCILIGFVFGRALIPSDGMMIYGDDIHRAYYFFREFFNHWISQGVFPWWNSDIFGGQPFIADPVVNIWYPPNWLFFFLPLNIAYSWHIAIHVFWACLGMYMFLIHIGPIGPIRRISPIGAWTGGVIFGLSGFFMARTFAGHVDVIATASWMPWVLWINGKWQMANGKLERKYLLFAAGAFALQLLAGYQTMAFFTVIAVGIIALLYSVRVKSFIPLFRVILAGSFGVALAAVQILPTAEFFRQSIRTFQFPYSWHSYGSYEWRSLLQFLNPFVFGNQYSYNGPPPNFIEHSAFVGIGGLVLAVFGVVRVLRVFRELRGIGVAFFLIVFFGLWVSLGPNAPIDLQKILWQFAPMYHYLRIPPRHLILVVFGLAGLAGIGLEYLFRSLKMPRLLRFSIVGIVIVEMVLFARSFIELKPIPEARHDKELIALLKKDQQPYRLLQNFGAWLPQRDSLDFDGVMAYGIQSATGYNPSILRSYYEFIAADAGKSGETAALDADVQVPYLSADSASAIDMVNIKYLMVPIAYDPFANNSRYMLRREDKTQEYRLYENTTVFPRFYYAQKECGTADVTLYTPNKIEVEVVSTCDDTLLSSENWYPGWHATIDGEKVTIGKLNNTFRTLFVPKGKHTIIYEYKPMIVYIGGVISLVTFVGLYFFWRIRKPVIFL